MLAEVLDVEQTVVLSDELYSEVSFSNPLKQPSIS
jgi:hypothetical protein